MRGYTSTRHDYRFTYKQLQTSQNTSTRLDCPTNCAFAVDLHSQSSIFVYHGDGRWPWDPRPAAHIPRRNAMIRAFHQSRPPLSGAPNIALYEWPGRLWAHEKVMLHGSLFCYAGREIQMHRLAGWVRSGGGCSLARSLSELAKAAPLYRFGKFCSARRLGNKLSPGRGHIPMFGAEYDAWRMPESCTKNENVSSSHT